MECRNFLSKYRWNFAYWTKLIWHFIPIIDRSKNWNFFLEFHQNIDISTDFFRKFPDISGSQTPSASSQRVLGQPILQSTRPSISIFHMRQAQISIVFSLSANAKIQTQAKRLGFKLGYHWAIFSFVNIYT